MCSDPPDSAGSTEVTAIGCASQKVTHGVGPQVNYRESRYAEIIREETRGERVTTTAAARPVGKLSPGRVYRGRGQWSFILHRVTGVAILGFLFLHIAGEAFIGVSPEAFDT